MPYSTRSPYVPDSGSISALMMRQGDLQAQQALNRGQAWAAGAQAIGQFAGAMGDIRQRQQESEATADANGRFTALMKHAGQIPTEELAGEIMKIYAPLYGPDKAMEIAKGVFGFQQMGVEFQKAQQDLQNGKEDAARKKLQDAKGNLIDIARGIDAGGGPDSQFGRMALATALPLINMAWGGELQGQELTPDFVSQNWDAFKATLAPPEEKPKLMERDPTKSLVNPITGETVSEAQPAAVDPMEQQMLEAQLRGRNLQNQRLAQEVAAGNAPPTPPTPSYQPKEVTVDGKKILANYDKNTGRYHDPDTGEVLSGAKPAPSTEQEKQADAAAGIGNSIKTLAEAADNIFRSNGPWQRVVSGGRSVAAEFGSDPEFKTYSDLRNSLASMIAVAIQGSRPSDADVFRAALPLIPDPSPMSGETRESARRKFALIVQMFNERLSPEMKEKLDLGNLKILQGEDDDPLNIMGE